MTSTTGRSTRPPWQAPGPTPPQPGIRYVGRVKDGLGRTGEALALADGDNTWRDGGPGRSRLIIDPPTGRLLAYEGWQAGHAYPSLSQTYRSMGWVGGLGERP